ncbi:hypothetical protein C8R44DRAFT_742540 [Mycena epipterygia]|nr:hypothetical protein C8R44DRAFT_742540 [Mycena epipterygia]
MKGWGLVDYTVDYWIGASQVKSRKPGTRRMKEADEEQKESRQKRKEKRTRASDARTGMVELDKCMELKQGTYLLSYIMRGGKNEDIVKMQIYSSKDADRANRSISNYGLRTSYELGYVRRRRDENNIEPRSAAEGWTESIITALYLWSIFHVACADGS